VRFCFCTGHLCRVTFECGHHHIYREADKSAVIGINLSLEEKKEAGLFVGARADDVGKGKKDTGYLYKALMVARRWGCECVAPQVSTGNRTRATIKALPATPHHSRPYGI
jgi:hypothetical protein